MSLATDAARTGGTVAGTREDAVAAMVAVGVEEEKGSEDLLSCREDLGMERWEREGRKRGREGEMEGEGKENAGAHWRGGKRLLGVVEVLGRRNENVVAA